MFTIGQQLAKLGLVNPGRVALDAECDRLEEISREKHRARRLEILDEIRRGEIARALSGRRPRDWRGGF